MSKEEKVTASFKEVMKSIGGRADGLERTFDDLIEMSTTPEGTIDISTLDNAPAVGYNGGLKCDVTSGPCSCGAWH